MMARIAAKYVVTEYIRGLKKSIHTIDTIQRILIHLTNKAHYDRGPITQELMGLYTRSLSNKEDAEKFRNDINELSYLKKILDRVSLDPNELGERPKCRPWKDSLQASRAHQSSTVQV